MSVETRFCDRCMTKTRHEIVEQPDTIYTYKRKRLYVCRDCGHKSLRRGLRPSAESVY
jgi:superfamily II helicase